MNIQTKKLDFTELDNFMISVKNKKGALIPVLHKAQEIFGYLPEEVLLHIEKIMRIPATKIYGVVTFYSFFSTVPKGKFNVSVCMGTACFVRGAENILNEFETLLNIKAGQTREDGLFSMNSIRCIGACGLAPVVMVNDKVYGRVKPQDVKNIIKDCLDLDKM